MPLVPAHATVRRARALCPKSPLPTKYERTIRASPADRASLKGQISRCLDAPFVDRAVGVFLTTWEIRIFPGLWADMTGIELTYGYLHSEQLLDSRERAL